jgi:uncharacterized membrane protein YjgN (DUF898 family)
MESGIRFGGASALVSAVVLLTSMRPIARFRLLLIVALLTIALVDSLADAYAIWAARESTSEAVYSMMTKIFICGILALMIHYKVRSGIIYVALVAMIVAHLVFTALTQHDDGMATFKLLGIFLVAVVISFGMHRLVHRLDKAHPQRR